MIKFLHVLAIAMLIGSAGYAYSIKYDTIYYAEQLAKMKARVQKERDAIAVLRAEWGYLNRPDRVQEVTDRHLPDIVPATVKHYARFSDLPERGPKTDEIGRKLEALGVLEPTATPQDKRPGGTPTTTTRTPAR